MAGIYALSFYLPAAKKIKMKCQWTLANGHKCAANAIFGMFWQGERWARLCGAHKSAAKKLWPMYEYKPRRVKKCLTNI